MKHLLLAKGLWGFVDGTEVLGASPTAAQLAEYNKRSQTAFSTLVMTISSSQLYLITSVDNPAEAWKALQNHFERDTLVNKLILKKQYFRMEMKEGTSVEQHIKAMKELTDKLAAIKAPISEEDQVVTLLGSLPSNFSSLVTALEARDTITLSYVQQSLIREEQRMSGDRSMQTDAGSGRALVGKQDKMKDKRACYMCGETGHFRKDCPKNRHKRKPPVKPKHNAKPAAEESPDEEKAFGASSDLTTTPEKWIIDSGASSHMTQNKKFLVDYEEFKEPQKISLGDGRTVEALGRGNVHFSTTFKMSDPKSVVMRGALFVPDLACNLFSVRAATAKGNSVRFKETKCWIRDRSGGLLGMGTLSSKLYYLDCKTVVQERAAIARDRQAETVADLWHQRMGHLNGQQLKQMVSQKLVRGMNIPKSAEVTFCEKCVEEKMARKPFIPHGRIRSKRPLQRVHSDVCGPMPTNSLGGKKYFVTFVDDYTRFCSVYFMRNKSEVFNMFKEFELRVSNECESSIATLRSDNGGEYLSEEFESYLTSKGIHHELSAPYSPAQNGVAERINRTLMESARSMMSQAGLPESYWAEAVATAAYLRNRSPSRTLGNTTPYERWCGEKPDLRHLRVFGCMAYAYIPDTNRTGKLSKKAEKLRFIGYSSQAKAYRLIDEKTQKITVRRSLSSMNLTFNMIQWEPEMSNRQYTITKDLKNKSKNHVLMYLLIERDDTRRGTGVNPPDMDLMSMQI